MCGIVGVVYRDGARSVSAAELQVMNDAIVHRGPDDEGLHVDRNVGIGMRRLSIIDLEGGHQPIISERSGQVIVFNGEVYNHAEERVGLEAAGHTFATRSDTEVVLRTFEQHGTAGLERLNGMFALAVHDPRERVLTVVRDRIGIKPLYYFEDDEKLVFASEIKAVLAHPGVRTGLDRRALAAYLRYGFSPPDATLFRGIAKLPAAHLMQIRDGRVDIREYWRPSYADKLPEGSAEVDEQLYELLQSAVRYQMVADVPLGAFLSGGFDSSGIVHMMSAEASGPVNTYSIGFGKGFENYNELGPAQRFARQYGTAHHEIVVDPDIEEMLPSLIRSLDEPLADSSFLVTYLVAKLARESVKVILSGVGGDELFGGYRRYLSASLGGHAALMPGWLRRGLVLPALRRMPVDRNSRLLNLCRLARGYLEAADLPLAQQYGAYTALLGDDTLRALVDEAPPDDLCARYMDECDSPHLLDRIMYYDLKTSLPEQLLMLTDKMTMATSLEARVPLLDHRVVEYAARVAVGDKVKGRHLRRIQKRVLRGKLPDFVFEQKKKGFGAPFGVWLRRDLERLVDDVLGEERLRQDGLFDVATVRGMIDDHRAMRADYTDPLLALVGFQIWAREYDVSLA